MPTRSLLGEPTTRNASIPGADDAEDEHYLAERYIPLATGGRLLGAYYALKPVIPRGVQRTLRRRRARRYIQAKVPAWPIEDVLVRLRAGRLERQLREQNADRVPFVNFWPGGRRFAVVLTHDIESEEGVRRIPELLEIEQRHGFASSWNFVAEWYPVAPEDLDRVREVGGEVGLHGIRHDGSLFRDRASFETQLPAVRRYMDAWEAVGFRSPSMYRNAAWMHELPCLYDSSFPQNDPFQPQPGGCCSIHPFFFGDVVELPVTLDQDHTVFELLSRDSIDLWRSKTEWLVEHHGLVNLLVHPDYMTPERLRLYEEMLVFLKGLSGGWHALPREVAAWWRERAEMAVSLQNGAEGPVVGASNGRGSVAWARVEAGRLVYDL